LRVHITLKDPQPCGEPQVAALRQQLETAGVEQLDLKYLTRYGLVRGELARTRIGVVQALPGVLAVETVGLVSAI
jgi:hypothetical protein